MNNIYQASLLNDEGIEAFLRGDEALAVASLTDSIRIFRRELVARRNDAAAKPTSTSNLRVLIIPDRGHCNDHDQTFRLFLRLPKNTTKNEETNEEEQHQCEMFPLQLLLDLNAFSAAVIFNLAMVHNLQAHQNQDTRHWSIAIKLYEMVLKLLEAVNRYEDRTSHVIRFAAVNNIIELLCCNGQHETARFWVAYSEDLMTTISNEEIIGEANLQMLRQKVLLLKAPEAAAAA